MTDREAMKMAFEIIGVLKPENIEHKHLQGAAWDALRQALAQPEQVSIEPPDYVEPITFDYHEGWEEGFKAGVGSAKNKKESTPSNADSLLHGGDGNYIKQAQPEQEPAAWQGNGGAGYNVGGTGVDKPEQEPVRWFQQFGDTPPKREWVGLTEGELIDIKDCNRGFWTNAAKIEQLLKDKNT